MKPKLFAEHGQHRNAQYNLGCKYAKGQGVIQSDALALKYWTVSAEGGHAQAQFNLGMYYANGSGVTVKNNHKQQHLYLIHSYSTISKSFIRYKHTNTPTEL